MKTDEQFVNLVSIFIHLFCWFLTLWLLGVFFLTRNIWMWFYLRCHQSFCLKPQRRCDAPMGVCCCCCCGCFVVVLWLLLFCCCGGFVVIVVVLSRRVSAISVKSAAGSGPVFTQMLTAAAEAQKTSPLCQKVSPEFTADKLLQVVWFSLILHLLSLKMINVSS